MLRALLGLLYDIHGNLPALEAVLGDARGLDVERWIVGGDVVLFGAWPAETVARLRELDEADWLRGNTDRWLIDDSDRPPPDRPPRPPPPRLGRGGGLRGRPRRADGARARRPALRRRRRRGALRP